MLMKATPTIGGDLSCYTIAIDRELYMDTNGEIDNTPLLQKELNLKA